jgi:hypothetical protein
MTLRGWSTLIGYLSALAAALSLAVIWWNISEAEAVRTRISQGLRPASLAANDVVRTQAQVSAMIMEDILRPTQGVNPKAAETRLDRDVARIRGSLDSIRSTIAGDPVAASLVARAQVTLDRWTDLDGKPALGALESGDRGSAISITTSATANEATAEMLDASTRLQIRTQTALASASERLSTLALRVQQSLLLAVMAFFLLLGSALIALRRGALKPVEAVRHDLRQVTGEAGLNHVIRPTGPMEIRALAEDAETMRRHLVNEIDEANAAREALQTHAPLVTQVRDTLRGVVPRGLPHLQAFAWTRPAAGVIAGDWWQFITRPDGSLCLVLADVSGHGLTSGVTAIQARAIIETSLRGGASPAQALTQLAGWMSEDKQTITAVICAFDAAGTGFHYANAGHVPPMVKREGDHVELLTLTGPLLSTFGGRWEDRYHVLHPRDTFIAYTDGLGDGSWQGHPVLGLEAVEDVVQGVDSLHSGDPDRIGADILALARNRASTWIDDVSLIVITRHSP